MDKRLAVCVPYRDRKEHLDIFVPYITKFLTQKKIEHKIFICHQKDNKPFNRGKLKNIAFNEARKEGYDYFAFHDVDILPIDDSCDYRYPNAYPLHLCVLKSEDDFKLTYQQYFGGCVLFTKEQFEKVNGYYNDYWGWGYEDDDLFYRVRKKGLANIELIKNKIINKKIINFNNNSYIEVMKNQRDKTIDKNGFSLFLLMKMESGENMDYLIGTKYNYFEIPFLFMGNRNILLFNKYEFFVVNLCNKLYMSDILYTRRPRDEWIMFFLIVDSVSRSITLFINTVNNNDITQDIMQLSYKIPLVKIENKKILFGNKPFIIGKKILPFRGKLAEIGLWNHVFSIYDVYKKFHHIDEVLYKNKILFNYDFENIVNNIVYDKGLKNNNGMLHNCSIEKINEITITSRIEPFRKIGRYKCLPHKHDGIVKKRFFQNHCIKLNKDAYINEKIYKTHVLQNRIDPDYHGLNSLSYKVLSRKNIYGFHTMIDVTC